MTGRHGRTTDCSWSVTKQQAWRPNNNSEGWVVREAKAYSGLIKKPLTWTLVSAKFFIGIASFNPYNKYNNHYHPYFVDEERVVCR